jgi:hypothetical protein
LRFGGVARVLFGFVSNAVTGLDMRRGIACGQAG